jgi:2,4-diketo-3-deoxy-L-fuconate hydrolase
MSWSSVVLAQASHATDPAERPWLVHRGRSLPLAQVAAEGVLARVRSIDALVADWHVLGPALYEVTEDLRTRRVLAADGVDEVALEIDAPVQPGQVFCTIANYRRQVVEAALDAGDGPDGAEAPARRAAALTTLQQRRRDGRPYVCLTSPHRVAAPRGRLVVPNDVETLDWEVELAAVMGSAPGEMEGASSPTVVAGYCLANDLTVRARVLRDDVPTLGSDWVQCKGLAGTLPLGPWFVPAWQLPDVSTLRLQLYLGDRLMQDEMADDMLFDVAAQVDHLSRHTRMAPGDVLCTGSPAGFGAHYRRFLRGGDVVRARAVELGEQHIECIANPVADRDLALVAAPTDQRQTRESHR